MISENKYLYVGCGNNRMSGFTYVQINIEKQFKKGGNVSPSDILADITRHNKRKPAFPTRLWFLEKFRNLK